MRAVFLVAGVCRTLVHAFQGHHRLELVEGGRRHLVNFLQADQYEFAQAEQVVLAGIVVAHLGQEIAAQFGRQQVVEPCSLVATLRADEHQNLMIDVALFDHASHQADQPLAEIRREACLFAPNVNGGGQTGDVVSSAVPGGQALQVVAERIVERHEVRMEHTVDVALTGTPHLLAHARPQ